MAADIGGLPAITLLLFLNTHKDGLEKGDFLQRLNEVTANILTDSYDSGLHNLINNNGWDESSTSFKTYELNVETLTKSLRLFTERRKDKASASRASLIDFKNIITVPEAWDHAVGHSFCMQLLLLSPRETLKSSSFVACLLRIFCF
jgi:hypothetical protein